MKLYFSHPFESRKILRKWELGFEKKTGIELINPFYDVTRKDIDDIDSGRKERYEEIDPFEIVPRDITQIAISEGIISVVNDKRSYGTIQEMVYSHIFKKPNYCLVTNGHENHPWIRYHSTKIFTKLKDLEKFLEEKLQNAV